MKEDEYNRLVEVFTTLEETERSLRKIKSKLRVIILNAHCEERDREESNK